jgi:ubiquinone biosynthesis protein UbiJ
MADWQKQAAQRFGENLAEFLAEESAILAASSNTSHFVAAVDGLRDDVARLEKRIQRLA